MNNSLTVQYALMCLEVLGEPASQALSAKEISDKQGIPRAQCEGILECLQAAGLINSPAQEQYSLTKPIEEFKVLEILQALTPAPKKAPAFQILFQNQKPALRKTLEAVSWAKELSCFPSDGLSGGSGN